MNVRVTVAVDAGQTGSTEDIVVEQPALNAVLFDFNPSSNLKVTRIKAVCAALVQEMNELRDDPTSTPAQKRMAAVAVTQLEITQMCAVKALFAKG